MSFASCIQQKLFQRGAETSDFFLQQLVWWKITVVIEHLNICLAPDVPQVVCRDETAAAHL